MLLKIYIINENIENLFQISQKAVRDECIEFKSPEYITHKHIVIPFVRKRKQRRNENDAMKNS